MKVKPIINRPTLTLVILSFILIVIPQLNRPASTEARTANLITHPPTTPQLRQIMGQQSFMFVEEDSQRYQLRGTDQSLWFTPQTIWVQTSEVKMRRQTLGVSASRQSPPLTTIQNTKLTFLNANPNVTIEPLARHKTKVSYFIGNNPDAWRTDVAVYQGLRYRNVYPDTDLVVSSQNGQVTWEWEKRDSELGRQQTTNSVAPSSVMVMVDDGNTVRAVSWDDSLLGRLTREQSVARSDSLFPVVGSHDNRSLQMNTRTRNVSPCQDSPDDLVWSTFLGSGEGLDIAVGNDNSVYVTGYTTAASFPTTAGAYDTDYSNGSDVFVAKLTSDGTALSYATYLGGTNDDRSESIAVDSSGNAYLTGYTSSTDFPATSGAYDISHNGRLHSSGISYYDAFVVKLNSEGTALSYATFLGGTSRDQGYAITVDSTGNSYVMGSTSSSNFPTTVDVFDTSHNGYEDIFVVKLNSQGNALSYSTFLGGTNTDGGGDERRRKGIAIDQMGNAYITDETFSADFPTTVGAYDTTHNGQADVFVAKLNRRGTDLVYSTFLGGNEWDIGSAVAVDAVGNAYIVGSTTSKNFPITTVWDDINNRSRDDVFAAKLNPDGSKLVYTALFAGTGWDVAGDIAIDKVGQAYLTGMTPSRNFPTTSGAYDTSYNGGWDIFVAKLNSHGTGLNYATFLGGTGGELYFPALALNSSNEVHVTGATGSANFPTTAGAYNTTSSGGVFISKLNLDAPPNTPVVQLSANRLIFSDQRINTTSTPQTITLTNKSTTELSIDVISISGIFTQTNTCGSSLAADDSCTLQATFTPTATQTFTGTLTIRSDACSSPDTISLSGLGIAPVVSLSTDKLAFGEQTIRQASLTQTITLQNRGPTDLNIDSISNNANFSHTHNCPATLAAEAMCTVNITFTPTTTGPLTGTLAIKSDAISSPNTIGLSGIGVAPMIGLSSNHLTASMIMGGAPPSAKNLTINNGGTGTFTWAISYQNDAAWWLAISPERGLASDEATISFANTNSLPVGSYMAPITISSDEALNSPQFATVTLTVTAKPVLVIQPTSLNFETIVGRNPVSQVINISNATNSVLSWTVMATPTKFNLSLNQTSGTTPATITVSINTTDTANLTTGVYKDVLIIKGDKAQDSPQAVNLKLLIKEPAKPDLVSNITTNNLVCLAHPTTVTTTVMNQGQAEAGTHDLSLYSNNTLIATSSVKVLTVGTTITFSHTLTPTVAGSYTLKAVADANNTITESNETNNESFIILLVQTDKTAPTGTIELNNGNNRTDTTQVNLTLKATKDKEACAGETITMRLSNNGLTWTAWQTYTTTLSWTLPKTSGNHIVSVQFQDEAGNISPTYTDTITLLLPESTLIVTPKSLTLTLKGGVVTSTTIMIGSSTGVLTWTATLTNSGHDGKRSISDWLTISPISGTTPSTTTITVDSTSLASGSYSHIVTIRSKSGNRLIPISVRAITRTTYLPSVIK